MALCLTNVTIFSMTNVTICPVLNETVPFYGTLPLVPKKSLGPRRCTVFRKRATAISEWNNSNAPENLWIELFKHFRDNSLNYKCFRIIIEYILCLPGTYAPIEQVFLLINKLLTAEKTQLQVSVLKAKFITKVNINKTCQEFYSF